MTTRSLNLNHTFAAWLALLALVLQLAAMPVANGHMLQRALERAAAHTVTICTPTGSTELQVSVDGKPVKTHISNAAHCVLCFAAGSAPLLTPPLFSLVAGLTTTALPESWMDAQVKDDAGTLWPWSHGPPA